MRKMYVEIGEGSFKLIDAHFGFVTRILLIIKLFFTGYFSFKSNTNITFLDRTDDRKAENRESKSQEVRK